MNWSAVEVALTPAVVRYSAAGLRQTTDGRIERTTHLFAKVSRTELTEMFFPLRLLVEREPWQPAHFEACAYLFQFRRIKCFALDSFEQQSQDLEIHCGRFHSLDCACDPLPMDGDKREIQSKNHKKYRKGHDMSEKRDDRSDTGDR